FFFQAEDGIRDFHVTGVQTCALPIFGRRALIRNSLIGALVLTPIPAIAMFRDLAPADNPVELFKETLWAKNTRLVRDPSGTPIKIGSASCREAVSISAASDLFEREQT